VGVLHAMFIACQPYRNTNLFALVWPAAQERMKEGTWG
jgi:hypothetical protein